MAIATTYVSLFERAHERSLSDALRRWVRHAPLLAVLALVAGIHIPTLGYYFFGDDFLVLGDVRTRGFGDYMRDVVLLRDLTPNWRPLTMAIYYGEVELFGFNAMAWRIVNLVIHGATVVLLYTFVFNATRRVFVASAAALIFAVSASAVHTVTYITALPHVLSEFMLIAALCSMQRYVHTGERRAGWYWLAFALFVAGFLANEGGVVLGAVIVGYYALVSLPRRRDVLDFMLKALPFAIASTLLIGALSGCGCQGVDEGFYGLGWHIPRTVWVYMSRLAYPVDAIPLEPSGLEWAIGSVVAASAIFFLIRGPHIARIAAVGMVLGLLPYAPGKMWTATRYTYMALPFFAILVAVAAGFVHGHAVRLSRPLAHVLAAAALFAVGGLYAWQTLHQTQPFLKDTERWELLARDLRREYPSVPAGSTVYVVDDEGIWSNAFWQPTWMTSVGRALYGEDVAVRALPSDRIERLRANSDGPMYLVAYTDGHLRRVSPDTVTSQPEQGD